MANPVLSLASDRRRAAPVPMGRERLAELLHRPSEALNGYRLTAGEMAWLLNVAIERADLTEALEAHNQ